MRYVIVAALAAVICSAFSGCATTDLQVQDQATALILQRMPVDMISFNKTPISDVMSYMAMEMSTSDANIVMPTQTLNGGKATYSISLQNLSASGTQNAGMVKRGPYVSCRVKDVTMLDVIQEIAKASRSTATIRNGEIVFQTKNVKLDRKWDRRWDNRIEIR